MPSTSDNEGLAAFARKAAADQTQVTARNELAKFTAETFTQVGEECTPWVTYLVVIASAAYHLSDTAAMKSLRFRCSFASVDNLHRLPPIYSKTGGTTPLLLCCAKWSRSSISRGLSIVATRTPNVGSEALPTNAATSSRRRSYGKQQTASSEARITDTTVNSEDILCRVRPFYSETMR